MGASGLACPWGQPSLVGRQTGTQNSPHKSWRRSRADYLVWLLGGGHTPAESVCQGEKVWKRHSRQREQHEQMHRGKRSFTEGVS